MANPKTLWDFEESGKYVVIYNQSSQRYGIDVWEKLKAQEGYTDQELAEVLNNFNHETKQQNNQRRQNDLSNAQFLQLISHYHSQQRKTDSWSHTFYPP